MNKKAVENLILLGYGRRESERIVLGLQEAGLLKEEVKEVKRKIVTKKISEVTEER